MPRYNYKCSACGAVATILHLYEEVIDQCEACEAAGTMEKLLSTPLYMNDKDTKQKIGDLTKDYIEQNREILEQEKASAKEDAYEPS